MILYTIFYFYIYYNKTKSTPHHFFVTSLLQSVMLYIFEVAIVYIS